MAVAAGIAKTYSGDLLLAGGTQMLAVAAIIKSTGSRMPGVVTTIYVRNDPSANVEKIAHQIGVKMFFVDPGFEDLGHSGLGEILYRRSKRRNGGRRSDVSCLSYGPFSGCYPK